MARRTKRLMESKGWTSAQLARYAGIDRRVVSTMFLGYTRPTRKNLLAIARVLDVPVTQIDPTFEEAAVNAPSSTDALSVSPAAGRPGYSLIIMNKVVRYKTALKIQRLVLDDAIDDRNEPAVG